MVRVCPSAPPPFRSTLFKNVLPWVTPVPLGNHSLLMLKTVIGNQTMAASFLPSILVPLVGIVFPAAAMAFLFLYIEREDAA